MGIKNYLIFGDVDSRDYGIEVFFQDVDRTPKRVYTRIEVAGRNGAVLIDEGRYEDVPIAYDCIALEDADRQAFVNALASKIGYYTLKDSFNSNEFYSAVFEGDVDPRLTTDREKSSFNVSFTRYPQRWLVDGEDAILASNGGIIKNPTPFNSNPLLAVKGYGTIEFNGYTIELRNETLGDITPESGDYRDSSGRYVYTKTFPDNVLNAGDSIVISDLAFSAKFGNLRQQYFYIYPISVLPTNTQTEASTEIKNNSVAGGSAEARLTTEFSPITLSAGESQTWTNTTNWVDVPVFNQNETQAGTISAQMVTTITYTATAGNGGVIEITSSASITSGSTYMGTIGESSSAGTAKGESTVSLIGNPTYIDCDLGDAYMIKDGTYVGLNGYIDLGSDLPTLASGNNEITFDTTVTELKITPRFWIL